MATYQVTINGRTWNVDASRAAVAVKYALDNADYYLKSQGQRGIDVAAKLNQLSISVKKVS